MRSPPVSSEASAPNLCPWCLANENREQTVQPDRPCPRCSYVGTMNGYALFIDYKLRFSFACEAGEVAARTTDAMIQQQDYKPLLPN
jgi:hypothetical protein